MARSGNEIREIFNLRYNNLNSGIAPGLNDFEISLLLTDAQKQIIEEYYTGLFAKRQPFESVERLRKNLTLITKEDVIVDDEDPPINPLPSPGTFRKCYSYTVSLKEDVWRVLYEHCVFSSTVKCLGDSEVIVTPVRHDELDKILKNPFKCPSDNFVLRVDIDGQHQLLSKHLISKYLYRYIQFPSPIIIKDLTESLD